MELGRRTYNAEGRNAPSLVAVGKKFFLFFSVDHDGPIHLGIFTVDADGDGAEATVDCDDDDETVHPDAEERCDNDRDDNCNGLVDEGCASEGGASAGGFGQGGAEPGGSSAGGAPGAGRPQAGGHLDDLDLPQTPPELVAEGMGLVGSCGCRVGTASTSLSWSALFVAMVVRRLRRRRTSPR